MPSLDLFLALSGVGLAVALRPWRVHVHEGPPWPWLLGCLLLPPLWCADRLTDIAVVQPLSGACLLTLMAGWPLTVLALVPITLLTAMMGDLAVADALHRGVWLGLLPATFALGLGAAARRWLHHHLMVYIFARGVLATLLSLLATAVAALLLHGGPDVLGKADLLLGQALSAWGESIITGMLTAAFVAFRPQWLGTYSDRLYLPRP